MFTWPRRQTELLPLAALKRPSGRSDLQEVDINSPQYALRRDSRAPSLRSLARPARQDLLPMDHDERQKRRDQGGHRGPDEGHETVLPTNPGLRAGMEDSGLTPSLSPTGRL